MFFHYIGIPVFSQVKGNEVVLKGEWHPANTLPGDVFWLFPPRGNSPHGVDRTSARVMRLNEDASIMS